MQYDYSLSMTFRLPTFLSFWGLLYSLIALLELVPPCLGDWPRFYWSLGALPNWRRSGAPSSSLKFSVVLEIAPNICGLSCYQSVFDIFSLGLNPLELKILSWLLIFTHFWGISVATKSHPLTRIMPATDVSPVWTSSNLRGLCSLNELADVKWIMHTCMYKLSHSLNPKHTPTCFIHSAQVMFDGGGLHDPKCFGATGAGLRKLGSARKVYFNAFIFQPIWMCWAGFCLQWKLHGKPELCLKYGPDSLCILGPLVLQGPILQNPFEAGGPCFGPHSCQLHMDDRKPTTVAVGSALSNGAIMQLDLLCAWSTSKGFTKFAFFTKQILDLDQTKYTPSLCLLWPVLLAGTPSWLLDAASGRPVPEANFHMV